MVDFLTVRMGLRVLKHMRGIKGKVNSREGGFLFITKCWSGVTELIKDSFWRT